ncbi:hypothetical protein BDY24DRAFT_90986 [Mrakia frigida]|uniref:uncharacterized protein n=1 Tax=Mrakia frigida TaxID=29902 RepID=UPI003FCC1B21
MDTFTKEQLSDLKRPELQKICKEHGIKGGNQKKDILVELILSFYQQQIHQDQPSETIEEQEAKGPEEPIEVDVRPEEVEEP